MKLNNNNGKLALVTAGAKGGVGKTTAICGIVDFYDAHEIEITKVDCDTENRRKGGFGSYFQGVIRHDIHGERGLDDVVATVLDSAHPITVVDLGAGSGSSTFNWFNQMGQTLGEVGVKVTLVCAVTANPAAITGLFNWAGQLGTSVQYLVVANLKDGDDFSYLHDTPQGEVFKKECDPTFVTMNKRVSQIQSELDNRNLSVGQALRASADVRGPILNRMIDQARLRTYFNAFNQELEAAKNLLLP